MISTLQVSVSNDNNLAIPVKAAETSAVVPPVFRGPIN
jgi:hypothetical protein